jgi:FADH2 O2-dependent halogenase
LSGTYDVAVVGSGFAGSLLAMILRRQGRSVVLLERGRHPRMAIGESSTPLSNLLLEELAEKYCLDAVKPLAKWGTWQRSYPDLPCGLKRGFSFFHHRLGEPDERGRARQNQLLVAASPHDAIADTHWFRADFDHFLVREAERAGVDYVDEIMLDRFADCVDLVTLEGQRGERAVRYNAKFVIDATGPHGFLHRVLNLGGGELPGMPRTQALYAHFSGVKRLSESQVFETEEALPYPIDAAAVHHVFEGGWIWVLRFNNGITSAGVAATDAVAARLGLSEGAAAWGRLLAAIPALREQFKDAQPVQQFVHMPRLGFRSRVIHGDRWALLPSAAGFVDPLLSTGFPLALLGVARLAEICERSWDSDRFASALDEYAASTDAELTATSQLIGALYANTGRFDVFVALSLLYFAAASYSEAARRLNKAEPAPSFLLHDDARFGPLLRHLTTRALLPRERQGELADDILRAIEPINIAGLGEPSRRNWYPVETADLFHGAHKLGATRAQIEGLLARCGFATAPVP